METCNVETSQENRVINIILNQQTLPKTLNHETLNPHHSHDSHRLRHIHVRRRPIRHNKPTITRSLLQRTLHSHIPTTLRTILVRQHHLHDSLCIRHNRTSSNIPKHKIRLQTKTSIHDGDHRNSSPTIILHTPRSHNTTQNKRRLNPPTLPRIILQPQFISCKISQ